MWPRYSSHRCLVFVSTLVQIVDLHPFTTFTILVAAITDAGVGPFQPDPVVLSTEEDSCATLSQPTLLYDRPNNLVLVKWQPQSRPRGLALGFVEAFGAVVAVVADVAVY